ncbi:thiamine pyrophosphate-binding protein [Sinomonas sp. JGH33]|uniref:Thiamine pyrophosphate-binding protein n=1 Tax=Sinomonas terricola TaxID=3110330 RepID=A0ABU5T270_9MICC|nr:thiamine pyrophosphate-binding protein [Sinomonas sp. JGH33]MEA5453757.1 thiamine pyrophosphate-binding protein [Sinomonas sp. JGH33]
MSNHHHADGGELLVQVLREAGVDTVFGVVSVHNLPLVEAVSRELRFVPVRHEATAVNAADGYARSTGGLGCALTSTGTGAGNAAGSLIESLSAGTSVLHVTGQVELEFLGSGRGFIHETKDQLGMLRAVSKAAHTIRSVEEASRVLREAVQTALAVPGGPVSVEWPIDLQYLPHPADPDEAGAPRAQAAAPPSTAPEGLDELIELATRAQRPLIWAGGGVARSGSELAELLETWGAGLLTSNSGRGAVPEDHPHVVGNYGATAAGQELLDEADFLLSLGTHFRSNETRDYALRIPAVHVQIDVDPAAVGRVYPVKAGVVADVRSVLPALTEALRTGSSTQADWRERVRRARAEVRAAQRASLGDHAALADALRAALPRDAVVARDVTIASSSWGNRLLEMYDPRDNVFPRGGGIGQGLGMGLGAAAGRPQRPTAVIAGDGGLAVHFGELCTLAQEKPWLTLLVFNDGGYGVLRNLQESQGKPRSGVDLVTPDFAEVASALGLPYCRIAHASEAAPVLAEAVATRGPVLVEIDLAAYGEMPAPFTPPVKVTTQTAETTAERPS